MFLIPKPKQINYGKGEFYVSNKTEIVLDYHCNSNDLEAARLLKEEMQRFAGLKIQINKAFHKVDNSIYLKKCDGESEGYTIEIKENDIIICGSDDTGLFYGVQTLRQIIRQNGMVLPCLSIKDTPYFKARGFFHDVTRGKVPTLKTLKELVDRLSFYKINQLQLYIEHTFAFKNLSEVWLGKDPLTAEEILELDDYCKKRNVELVPSLSTFGHLYEILVTKSYSHLCELDNSYGIPFTWYDRMAHHTIDVSNEESIEFVKNMIQEFIPLFSSNKFNICCDETFDLGKGKSSKLNEKMGTGKLYIDFLNTIIKYVKGYDKEVMFWGDVIVRHNEYLKDIPEDVICLNWAYYAEGLEADTKIISQSGIKQYVCPGVGGWNRLMNSLDSSFINISKMISYGKKYGACGVLNTDWGDYGHINLFANSMPGMIYGAALSWSPDDKIDVDKFDEVVSTLEFGKTSKKLISLLRELSKQEVASWSFIVWWREEKVLNNEFLKENIKEIIKVDNTKITNGYYRARELEKEILAVGANSNKNRELDIREFVNSARGVALMNAICLVIKKYEFNCHDVEIVIPNNKLAIELEYWFTDFSDLWHSRNKESEIHRIRDIIIFICSFLRNIKGKACIFKIRDGAE